MRMLLNDMKRALDRGVKIRILTGNYLGITQPSALYLIKSELGDRVDLRLYNETSRSFHPKSYIFHYESSNEIYIGSSNISKSALTSGIEWNYRFSDTLDKKNYELFYATFEDLFLNHSIIIDDEELKRYSKAWKKPAVSKDLAKYDATEDGEDRNAENVRMLYRPRGAQIEALYALQESRMEGAAKGLVYAATGIGKTYLAAFDSAKYKRVLFVAHREEILKQAVVSFKNVRNSADYGFFDGKEKDRDKSVIFASVATLGRTEYLNETYFPADYFEYVIIDEFHHAVTDQYRRIVEYFQPQFLLGLTATPERMDGKNIYEICDYNVPYQISLKEAINKGMPYSCYDAEELKIIVEKLVACKRYVTAVNIIGHSECEAVINAECIYKLMKLAGTEESIGVETLDDYAVQKIIGWFQQQEDIDLELRSDIEFIYLPMLDEYSEVRPRALNTRLSLEPEYFCSLIELFYKERNGEKREIELNKSLSDRLYEILFQFKVIPGIDWNGNFDAKRFDYWMKTVKTWSRDNDRYEVAMHTVGSGLSYAELDEDKLPQTAIIEELNRVENEELRRGYYLGIINQRGVHWIDPEGKPELELAEDYENKANIAESRGYSRYAGILRGVADEFKREAKSNILEAKNGDDE